MHTSAYTFVASVVPEQPGAVLDIGSLNVNGTVRDLFSAATSYHGIDIRSGDGVDQVIGCADYDGDQAFDTVVSTEVLEHMPDPSELIACAKRALRRGGLLIITAAGPYRVHHGVDGGPIGEEHYQNITPEALVSLLAHWRDVEIVQNAIAHDIYATARRP